MIGCHRCGKENQDHYKFCLGCGAELTSAPKSQEADVGMMQTMLAEPGKTPSPGAVSVQPRPVPGSDFVAASADVPTRVGQPIGVSVKPAVAGGGVSPLVVPPREQAPAWVAPQLGQAQPSVPSVKPLPGVAPVAPSIPPLAVTPAASGTRICPSCQSEVPPAFKFCGVCGCKLPEESAQPAAVTAAPVAQSAPVALMTLIRPDGTEGGTHELHDGENTIGRHHGAIFENDGYLSPTHAVMHVDTATATATIEDLGSLNGVFVKMTGEEEILPGQIIRIGQELLRFDTIEPPRPSEDGTEVMGSPNPGYWGKLTVVIGKDVDGSSYPLLGDSVTLGRERGEINFPDDGYVSGLHARLSCHEERVVLADLGSSNGTFIKISGERPLGHDSFVLLGQQLFRLSLTR